MSKKIKQIVMISALLLCLVLIFSRSKSFYEEREYYAINCFEKQYDLLDKDTKVIRQKFVAKQSELRTVYLRFYIENLVDLNGRMSLAIVDEKGKALVTTMKYLSSLTWDEDTDWTGFGMGCVLEKGKEYTLEIRTNGVRPGGACKLYLSSNKGLLFRTLFLNEKKSSKRLEGTFLYNTFCMDDIVKMVVLILFTGALITGYMGKLLHAIPGRRKIIRGVYSYAPFLRNVRLRKVLFWLTPLATYYLVQSLAGYALWLFLEQLFDFRGLFNLLIYGCLLVLFYVVTNRSRFSASLLLFISWFIGSVNYFVWDFRGSPIVAADLESMRTAANVAKGYRYTFGMSAVWGTVLLICFLCITFTFMQSEKMQRKKRLSLTAVFLAVVLLGYGIFFHTDLMKKMDITVSVWMPERNYAQNGSALSYLLTWTYFVVEKPAGYSETRGKEIAKRYESDKAGSDEGKISPNIIAIMNESFSDLSVDAPLQTSEDYMPFIRSLKENTVKGQLYVSVLGGNTANTEFEFLTGNSMAFFPARSVPYNSYLKKETGSLTSTLKDQGYQGNLAIHPYAPEGWNRERVYPLLGFEGFLSEKDFEKIRLVRDFVSDETDYQKLIKLYEESKRQSSDPTYLFSVTMQNHGGYTGAHGLIEEKIKVKEGKTKDDQLTQYINLIKESDRAFEKLIAYFKKVKEPTVVVMFGDHQPGFSDRVYEELMGGKSDSLPLEELQKMYQVPYVIWANYDIPEETKDMSANYLSSYLLKITGSRMTGYQKYLLDLQKKIPVLGGICYIGDDGVIRETGEKSPYSELIREYQILQYNELFDDNNRIPDFFYLKE